MIKNCLHCYYYQLLLLLTVGIIQNWVRHLGSNSDEVNLNVGNTFSLKTFNNMTNQGHDDILVVVFVGL